MENCQKCEEITSDGYGPCTCPVCGQSFDWVECYVITIKPGYVNPENKLVELTPDEWLAVVTAREGK